MAKLWMIFFQKLLLLPAKLPNVFWANAIMMFRLWVRLFCIQAALQK